VSEVAAQRAHARTLSSRRQLGLDPSDPGAREVASSPVINARQDALVDRRIAKFNYRSGLLAAPLCSSAPYALTTTPPTPLYTLIPRIEDRRPSAPANRQTLPPANTRNSFKCLALSLSLSLAGSPLGLKPRVLVGEAITQPREAQL
jgi:hypothetical protein